MKRWKGQTSKVVAVLLAAALTASPTTSYAAVLTNEEQVTMDEVETAEEQVTMDEPVEGEKIQNKCRNRFQHKRKQLFI